METNFNPTNLSSNLALCTLELNDGQAAKMYANDAARTLIGLDSSMSPEDSYIFWQEHIEERAKGLVSDAIEKIVAGQEVEVQYPFLCPDGKIHILRSFGKITEKYENGIKIEGFHQDLTEVLHLDAEEDFFNSDFSGEAAYETDTELIETIESKSKDFLFNMSHDIRTPMNAIMGFTNMAMRNVENKEMVLDSLAKTQVAGELLLTLINNILDMSRIEFGSTALDQNAADVTLSFVNIEDTMQEMARKKNIDLSFTIENIKDRYVYCDLNRCVRILVNIISNAIKYTEEGGTVKVKGEQIDSKDGYGIYKYTVEDNGIGMSEEFVGRVFDEFSREQTSTISGIQGTGLGLSVCRSFVKAMNGSIECQSKKGEGSVFTVILPLKIQEGMAYTSPINRSVVSGMEPENIDLSGSRVLLVEDNELNMEIAEYLLTDDGMEVETAIDGTYAVDMLREKGPDYYDYILMDIQMPLMDGYEATMEIRRMYPDSEIPIIAVSANAFPEDKAASIAAGMNDHVSKPIDINELKAVMAKYQSYKLKRNAYSRMQYSFAD